MAPGGMIFHVLNRANARRKIFQRDSDYLAFERIMEEGRRRYAMRILSHCVMPNHWHMVLWPKQDGDLSRFVGWVSLTHTQRWHAHNMTVGTGHLYQGRYKSFPVQDSRHLLIVCRYVERNALRGNLVARAEQWRWCSLWRREQAGAHLSELLSDWPIKRPEDWVEWVNTPQTRKELQTVRRCAQRGQPFGRKAWVDRVVRSLGLDSTLKNPGRPRIKKNGS